jgi:dTDP-4-amino-4,6-dideoxygalactose transaminase
MVQKSKKMIPIIKPDIDIKGSISEIKKVLESGILTKGKNVLEFEKNFSDFLGVKYALTTTSATTALHMSLVALGVKQGDEILVSDFTFPATANVIIQTGAKPVLVDIDSSTYNINLNDLKNKITEKTKGIIVVDAFGYPVDIDKIRETVGKDLFILEDSACAFGSIINKKKAGSNADISCFSFHPRKVLTTGEGGMIATNRKDLVDKILILRNHGGILNANGYYDFVEAGFNYRMTEIQAVLGINQLKNYKKILASRREKAKIYFKLLRKISAISLINEEKNVFWNFQSFIVLLDEKIDRGEVVKEMRKRGIETILGTYALHAQPLFRKYGYKAGDLFNSYKAFKQTLTLPLFDKLSEKEIKFIVENLSKVINNFSK